MIEYDEYIKDLKLTILNQEKRIKLYEQSTALDYQKRLKMDDKIAELETEIENLKKSINS